MTVYESIRNDHVQARDIIEMLAQTTTRAARTRESHFQRLMEILLPHQEAEEHVFYPALTEHHETRQHAMKSYEEHGVAKTLMNSLDSLAKEDDCWGPRFEVLADLLERHFQAEESHVFEGARALFSDEQASQMTEQFEQVKRQVRARTR